MVTDDIIILQEGDRVPADATVLTSVNLLADESLLTGESVPVRKNEWDTHLEKTHPGGDDLPFVYSGSLIVQGSGMAKVTAIGMNTEIGDIGKALESVTEEETKLKREMGSLIKKLAIIGISLCLLVIAVYTILPRRFTKRLSCGTDTGNGHAARGISRCPCGVYGTWRLAYVEAERIDQETCGY